MINTAVILAFDTSSRLSPHSTHPVMMQRVCGLRMITRTILSTAKAGIQKIIIVTNAQDQTVGPFVLKKKWPVVVEVVVCDESVRSEGAALLSLKEQLTETFILILPDVIFDHAIIHHLIEADLQSHQALLAVDFNTARVFDKNITHKVDVDGEVVRAVHPTLAQFKAVSTHLFLLSPAFFATPPESIKEDGSCSLWEHFGRLAVGGVLGFFDMGKSYWQIIKNKKHLRHAEHLLFESCRKPTDGLISKNINRHISLWLTQFLVRTPLTANSLTVLLLILGLYTGYLASDTSYWRYALAGFLFNLNSILDGCDGELAKLKFTTSKTGQWLDTIGDNTTLIAFLIGTTIGLWRENDPLLKFVGPLALAGLLILFLIMFYYIVKVAHSGSLRAVQEDFEKGFKTDWLSRVLIKVSLLIKREFYALFFCLLALIGKPQWVLWSLALGTHVAWVVILKNAWKKIQNPKS